MLIALQGERDHVTERLAEINAAQAGLHPTGEARRLMAFLERLQSRIRELTDALIGE